MTTTTTCRACGTQPLANARFCHGCGASIAVASAPAEFKQVTVLFADVVRSMDVAAAVGPERLRELMAGLFDRCAAVVRRFGGTVDKFTGDGIMAVFGAPVALEDHALRACLAALEIQRETDDVSLQLRIGLNSGEVVAGEIGSGPGGYTAVGEQVGLAQRMESVAPPGGVLLSESTAHLVEEMATLGEPELVGIKGAARPVRVRRLLAVAPEHRQVARQDPSLVGRGWEMGALTGLLDQAIGGTGCVIGIVGPPGIGKSRMVREVSATAAGRGVDVFIAHCESLAGEIPFYAVTSLMRTALGVAGLDDEAARARVRGRAPEADPQDLLLLEDLLGIRDSGVALPAIDPDARRRRLTRLVNTVSLARTAPALFVVEDAHWIDEVSELLLADFLAVIRQTPSLMVVTYRPEYQGALTRTPNSQTITLTPLNAAQSAALVTELIGTDPSAVALSEQVAERAAGNPFFVEEMVRDLAERGVLTGVRGNYVCSVDRVETTVPVTLQATIAARIDRLDPAAKQTLNAASVIGLRFSAEELTWLDGNAEMSELIAADLVDQVKFTPNAEYAFHHPLIRTVAYESQLKSDRTELHRRLAAAIEQCHPDSLDQNAALIAEHVEAAGDLRAAFEWHMRAGAWAHHRAIRAARTSWERARAVADRLPVDDPDRTSMRIAPRMLLSGSAWRAGGIAGDAGFDELGDLCATAGDKVSLVVGMAGAMTVLLFRNRFREAASVASDCCRLLAEVGDPLLEVGIGIAPGNVKYQAAEAVEGLRLAQRTIDLADGDPTRGSLVVGSPLALAIALRGACRCALGLPGWKKDLDQAVEMARRVDVASFVGAVLFKYGMVPQTGALLPDATADRDTAEALQIAEDAGDDFALDFAQLSRGIVLVNQGGPQRETGLVLLSQWREKQLRQGYTQSSVRYVDVEFAKEKVRLGDLDGAIELARTVVDYLFDVGEMITRGEATRALVESLLLRGSGTDLAAAQAAVERLAAVPTEPEFVVFEIPLLRMRALLARANGDEDGCRDFADRYLKRATEVGYQGHIALAQAMRPTLCRPRP